MVSAAWTSRPETFYQKHVIIGITLLTTLVSFKPKVIFWMLLIDSTAFRFTTNGACLMFVDSIYGLAKFSPIIVSQFLQYNTSFTHNAFLSVIKALTHFLEQALHVFFFFLIMKETCVNQNKLITFTYINRTVLFCFLKEKAL